MNKRDLWDVFMRTGRVSDYLKYKKAEERTAFDNSEEAMAEFSQELTDEFPQTED